VDEKEQACTLSGLLSRSASLASTQASSNLNWTGGRSSVSSSSLRPMSAAASTGSLGRTLAPTAAPAASGVFVEARGARARLQEQAERTLRKLFLDVDFALEFCAEKHSHKPRCDHLDRCYDWFEKHAKVAVPAKAPLENKGFRPGLSSPWLQFDGNGRPPPGSLRGTRSPQR